MVHSLMCPSLFGHRRKPLRRMRTTMVVFAANCVATIHSTTFKYKDEGCTQLTIFHVAIAALPCCPGDWCWMGFPPGRIHCMCAVCTQCIDFLWGARVCYNLLRNLHFCADPSFSLTRAVGCASSHKYGGMWKKHNRLLPFGGIDGHMNLFAKSLSVCYCSSQCLLGLMTRESADGRSVVSLLIHFCSAAEEDW